MATVTKRGKKFSVVYYYYRSGERLQQWESYDSERLAKEREAYISYLEKIDNQAAILLNAEEYRREKEGERQAKKGDSTELFMPTSPKSLQQMNFADFYTRWLPMYAQKIRMKPGSYEARARSIRNHVLPYFGERRVSETTALDIDLFLKHLSRKKCMGSKAYNKKPSEVATLSSGTIKKAFDSLMLMLKAAKTWDIIDTVPEVRGPVVKYKKRGFWTKEQMQQAMRDMESDKLLHLAIHIAFICSFRVGEILAIKRSSINLGRQEIYVAENLQRVTDEALVKAAQDDVLFVFPKQVQTSKSSLILCTPKTEKSKRTLYFNEFLADEIRARTQQIENDKRYHGEDYNDYGLLFCYSNGNPIERRKLEQRFHKWQIDNECEPLIDIQTLRKSSSMY